MPDMPPGERPPVFPRWSYWYVLLVLSLAVMILLFHAFTKAFS
ncbi:hypothetical protein [Chitinophaga parva]|nr:hypothetical protein [Chitinophaga parva]